MNRASFQLTFTADVLPQSIRTYKLVKESKNGVCIIFAWLWKSLTHQRNADRHVRTSDIDWNCIDEWVHL